MRYMRGWNNNSRSTIGLNGGSMLRERALKLDSLYDGLEQQQ